MTAMEKVAWLEFVVSVTAVAAVTAMYPWLGNGALGAFGVLGFVGCGAFFLRSRGQAVAVDERDRAIELRATRLGIETAWMGLFLTLIVLVLWATYRGHDSVRKGILTWAVFAQFAVCYGVKGLVSILAYRRQHRAP